MAQKRKLYQVQGTITNTNGQPLEGLLVKATDQDPNTPENTLGVPVDTNAKGECQNCN